MGVTSDRGPAATRVERNYRVSGVWPLRLFVVFNGLLVIGEVAASPPHVSAGEIAVLAGLGVLVLAVLVSAWVWNERPGIHVSEAGLRCLGATGNQFFAWPEIDGFGITRRGATWLITVELKSGKRATLSQGMGWL